MKQSAVELTPTDQPTKHITQVMRLSWAGVTRIYLLFSICSWQAWKKQSIYIDFTMFKQSTINRAQCEEGVFHWLDEEIEDGVVNEWLQRFWLDDIFNLVYIRLLSHHSHISSFETMHKRLSCCSICLFFSTPFHSFPFLSTPFHSIRFVSAMSLIFAANPSNWMKL